MKSILCGVNAKIGVHRKIEGDWCGMEARRCVHSKNEKIPW
jgi:hypothetical protein